MNKKLEALFDYRERGYKIFNHWLHNNNEYIEDPEHLHRETTVWVKGVAETLKSFFKRRDTWNSTTHMFWTVTNTYKLIEEIDANSILDGTMLTDSGKCFRYTGMLGTTVSLDGNMNRLYWLSYLNHQLKLLDATIDDVTELLEGKPAQPARKPWKT